MDRAPKVSIVLPVADESAIIGDTLEHLLSLGAHEVIVVDGASSDGTDSLLQQAFPNVKWLQRGIRNRAAQMNLGASAATGDAILFVHVDMRLPERAIRERWTEK